MNKLKGNTILITGGTSGIGFELVKRFYELNNKIIVISSNEKNLSKLREKFPLINTIVCDLSDINQVVNLIEKCKKDFSDINILINNAGIQFKYSLLENTYDYHNIVKETQLNFITPMILCYYFIPVLKKNNNSAIINVSSTLAIIPKKQTPIYCGTKAAIHISTKSLRYQLEGSNIKVFEIIPPLVDTNMTQDIKKSKVKKISPESLVNEFIIKFNESEYEMNIGKVKILRLLQRLSPNLADRIIKNGV
ncbi:MAG: SDR family NAD(P)-dependent oxidoreductase [Candidatus Sericytochromatia bacterium]